MYEFLQAVERPDLLDSALFYARKVLAVFTQVDTWDTHTFILYEEDDDKVGVAMFDVGQPRKGHLARKGDIEEALSGGCPDDAGVYHTVGEAVHNIAWMGAPLILTDSLREAWEQADAAEREGFVGKEG